MNGLAHRLFRDSMRRSLAKIGYRVPSGPCRTLGTWGLKDRIMGGYTTITILNQDRFAVELDAEAYCEAVRVGFYAGYQRARRQCAAARSSVTENSIPTAWVLVTSYYGAFFAAVELLRVAGIWVAFFEQNEIERVLASALTPHSSQLTSGPYLGTNTNWNQETNTVRICFSRRNGAAHQIVWSQAQQLLFSKAIPSSSKEWVAFDRLSQFLGCGQKGWLTPSETRNMWNYQRAELYGEVGQRDGMLFRKILSHASASHTWVASKKLSRNDSSEAASVAYVMTILDEVLEHTREIILDPTSLSRLAAGRV